MKMKGVIEIKPVNRWRAPSFNSVSLVATMSSPIWSQHPFPPSPLFVFLGKTIRELVPTVIAKKELNRPDPAFSLYEVLHGVL
jgi:hypothetical protein